MATLITRDEKRGSGLTLVFVLLEMRRLLFGTPSRSKWIPDEYGARTQYDAPVRGEHYLARRWSFRGALDRVLFLHMSSTSTRLMTWDDIVAPLLGDVSTQHRVSFNEWLQQATEQDARMLLHAVIYHWNQDDKKRRSNNGFSQTVGEVLARATTVSRDRN